MLSAVVPLASAPDLLAVALAASVVALPLLSKGSEALEAKDEAFPAGPVVAVPLDLQPGWLMSSVRPAQAARPTTRLEKRWIANMDLPSPLWERFHIDADPDGKKLGT